MEGADLRLDCGLPLVFGEGLEERSRTRSCAVASASGRRSANERRSPFTLYCRAGKTLQQDADRRHDALMEEIQREQGQG